MPPMTKTTTRNGKTTRSKACRKLWPRKAIAIWATTTISRDSSLGMWVSWLRAKVPLTLLTANQPMPAMIALRPAGSALPKKPNEIRDRIICGTPDSGPRADRTPWVRLPRPVPSTMARIAIGTDWPKKSTAMTPTKTVANSMFGETQVKNSRIGLPWRSLERDELGAAGFDGDDRVAVRAFSDLTDDGEGVRTSACRCHSACSPRGSDQEGCTPCRRGR